MADRLDRTVSIVLMLSAAAIAMAFVYRTLHVVPRRVSAADTHVRYVKSWRDALPLADFEGGTPSAPITIVELADLQCPACRGFQRTVNAIIAQRSADVRVLYVPLPLSYHRFAPAAAKGGECAARMGKLPAWINVLYEQQDSLGLKSWGAFARDAAIADTARIAACALDSVTPLRIDRALAFAKRIHFFGTPTVLVNGWMFPQPPSKQELDSAIDAVLDARSPG